MQLNSSSLMKPDDKVKVRTQMKIHDIDAVSPSLSSFLPPLLLQDVTSFSTQNMYIHQFKVAENTG